jgi:hypothetical protein
MTLSARDATSADYGVFARLFPEILRMGAPLG